MAIEDLIQKKDIYDERMLIIPLEESVAISDFMEEVIALITSLQEQIENRMLCTKYKVD